LGARVLTCYIGQYVCRSDHGMVIKYLVWLAPLWVAIKYRILFFSDNRLGAALAILWGGFVIWASVIAPDVDVCAVEWEYGVPIVLLIAALFPILIADTVSPALGASTAFIASGPYIRAWSDGVCFKATAVGGIGIAALLLFVHGGLFVVSPADSLKQWIGRAPAPKSHVH